MDPHPLRRLAGASLASLLGVGLVGVWSCDGVGAGPADAGPVNAGPPAVIEPVWQKQVDVPFVQAMTTGRSGVVVVGGPDITMVDPDGNVVATAPMPGGGSNQYDNVNAVKPTADGGLDMLVVDDVLRHLLSEHGADLQQTQLVDTAVQGASLLVTSGVDSYVLWQDGRNGLHLLTIEGGAIVSNRDVSLPPGSLFEAAPAEPALLAADGTLLFSGNGNVGTVAGIAILRVHPDDAVATVLAVGLKGNEVGPLGMIRFGDEIIVVAGDTDDRAPPAVSHITAFALDATGTRVVRAPVRVEENSLQTGLLGAQLVDGRVVMIQWDQDKYVLLSFDAKTFAAYPTLELPIPDGDWPGPYGGHLATYDDVLYAVVTATNAGGWQTILQRLPPLDQATAN